MTIVSGSYDSTARLWDANTGSELHTLTGHTDAIVSVAYSPDGMTVATASWDGTVRLWDTNTGDERRTLTGHTAEVNDVSFSPDGNTSQVGVMTAPYSYGNSIPPLYRMPLNL